MDIWEEANLAKNLEEAIAGVRIALQEGGIVVVGGIDGRNALGIPADPPGRAHAWRTQ